MQFCMARLLTFAVSRARRAASSIREVADRLDGKVAQTITGKDESPLIPEVSDERLGLALAVFLAKKSKGAE